MATATQPKRKEAKNRPVHEIRFGRVRDAIWRNETEPATFYNLTISRLYKDGDEWKDSTSFGRDDLPLVANASRSPSPAPGRGLNELADGNRSRPISRTDCQA